LEGAAGEPMVPLNATCSKSSIGCTLLILTGIDVLTGCSAVVVDEHAGRMIANKPVTMITIGFIIFFSLVQDFKIS
jgi:hypothetical protein